MKDKTSCNTRWEKRLICCSQLSADQLLVRQLPAGVMWQQHRVMLHHVAFVSLSPRTAASAVLRKKVSRKTKQFNVSSAWTKLIRVERELFNCLKIPEVKVLLRNNFRKAENDDIDAQKAWLKNFKIITRVPLDHCSCCCFQRKKFNNTELLKWFLAGRNRIMYFCKQTNGKRHGQIFDKKRGLLLYKFCICFSYPCSIKHTARTCGVIKTLRHRFGCKKLTHTRKNRFWVKQNAPKRLQLQGHDSHVCYFCRQQRTKRNETVERKDVRF